MSSCRATNAKEYREYKWSGFPRRVPVASSEVPASVVAVGARAVVEQVAAPAPFTADASPNAEDHKQRLTFRFLRLPTLDRYHIALKLGLMREGDDALPPNTVFLEVFQRAVEARRLADLWDETEMRHDDRAPLNPFRSPLVGE